MSVSDGSIHIQIAIGNTSQLECVSLVYDFVSYSAALFVWQDRYFGYSKLENSGFEYFMFHKILLEAFHSLLILDTAIWLSFHTKWLYPL